MHQMEFLGATTLKWQVLENVAYVVSTFFLTSCHQALCICLLWQRLTPPVCAMATDGVACWKEKEPAAPSPPSPPVAFSSLSEQILMHGTTSCQGEDRDNSVAYCV